MKKRVVCAVLGLLVAVVTPVKADIIGAMAGYDYWYTFDHGDNHSVYFQLEHPVPLIPNWAVRYGTLNSDEVGGLEFDHADTYWYYEIFDNPLVTLDLGAGVRQYINGSLSGATFEGTSFLANIEAETIKLGPFKPFGTYDIGWGVQTSFQDLELGVRINLVPFLKLQAGVRVSGLKLDDINGAEAHEVMKGFNVGLRVDI